MKAISIVPVFEERRGERRGLPYGQGSQCMYYQWGREGRSEFSFGGGGGETSLILRLGEGGGDISLSEKGYHYSIL